MYIVTRLELIINKHVIVLTLHDSVLILLQQQRNEINEMTTLIKNTDMTTAQKTKAFEVVGSYIKLDKNSETTVNAYNEGTSQIIVKVQTNSQTYFAIIGAQGKVINCGWC